MATSGNNALCCHQALRLLARDFGLDVSRSPQTGTSWRQPHAAPLDAVGCECPSNYTCGDIIALDRAYIDYVKFEEPTRRDVVYVTKMKKNLVYETESDTMYMNPEGLMECHVQHVIFRKHVKDGDDIVHHARIITYVDIKKGKARLVSLLTNDMEMEAEEIVEIYRKRWEIELLFKLLKQNFPLRYFYGESANAIKIQIWVTLIANLLLMVI